MDREAYMNAITDMLRESALRAASTPTIMGAVARSVNSQIPPLQEQRPMLNAIPYAHKIPNYFGGALHALRNAPAQTPTNTDVASRGYPSSWGHPTIGISR